MRAVAASTVAGASPSAAAGSAALAASMSWYRGATMLDWTSRILFRWWSTANLRMPVVRFSRRTPIRSSTSKLAKAHGRRGRVMLKLICIISSVLSSMTTLVSCRTVRNELNSSTKRVPMNSVPSKDSEAPERVPLLKSSGIFLTRRAPRRRGRGEANSEPFFPTRAARRGGRRHRARAQGRGVRTGRNRGSEAAPRNPWSAGSCTTKSTRCGGRKGGRCRARGGPAQ